MRADDFLKSSDKYIDSKIFFIYGEQDYLIDESVKRLIKLFNADDMSMTRFEGSPKAGDVINQLQNLPFFSEYSVVICEQIPDQTEGERLLSFLQEMPSHGRLIFAVKGSPDKRKSFVKGLLKISLEITAEDEKDIADWLVKSAKKRNVVLSKADAEYMINLAGTDMYALKGELDKLCFLGKDKITLSDIEDNVSKSSEYNIFMLNTLMLDKKYKEAFSLAEEIIKTEKTAIPLISLLSNRFYQMYLARCCIDAGMRQDQTAEELQKSAKLNRFAAKFIIADARKLSQQKLKESIKLLAEYDAALKSGGADSGIEYILTSIYMD